MAEFTEVMRQARRLCEEQQNIDFCVRCPMQGKDGCMVVADAENIDYVEVERKIMDWAKEYPEPVYPSCDECLERPMPAEVAEKLGIKPVEFAGMTDGFCCVGKRRDDDARNSSDNS